MNSELSVKEIGQRIYFIRGHRVMLDSALRRKLNHSLKSEISPPFVFTEQGVAMLSSSLKSKTAILVNIAIIRTFVKLRETLESNKELLNQLNKIESKLIIHRQKTHHLTVF